MAFKLTKAERKRIDDLLTRMADQGQKVQAEVESYNETVNEARSKLDDEIDTYKEIRDELRGVIEDIHSEKEGEYDDKSDNWRDGDRGSSTYDWIEKLNEVKSTLEEDIEIPDAEDLTIELPDTDEIGTEITDEPDY